MYVCMYVIMYLCSSCVGQVVSTLAFGADDPRFKSRWGRRKRKFISLLLSSASEGTVSRRSSRPRALVARVSCNLYTDLKQRLHLHFFLHLHLHLHFISMHAGIYVRMYVCMHTCKYVCMYVCVRVNVCMYVSRTYFWT